MRCKWCGKLIIHKFNNNYNRLDKKRQKEHLRNCKSNPFNFAHTVKKINDYHFISKSEKGTLLHCLIDKQEKNIHQGKDIQHCPLCKIELNKVKT